MNEQSAKEKVKTIQFTTERPALGRPLGMEKAALIQGT